MRNLLRHIALLSLLGLMTVALAPSSAWAQLTPIAPDTTRPRALAPPKTAAEQKAAAAADSAKRTERLFGLRLTRPAKAALLSAVAPGAGQIYNRRWWKLPLVYGALGGTIYGEYFYQTRFSEYVAGYEARQLGQPDPGTRSSQEVDAAAVQRGIVFYRGYRDIFYLYIGLAYGLQILDAVVDAHLKDFDVSDDLSLHWEPTLLPVPGRPLALPTAPGVAFALKVK
jgi:hypothetical protein